MNQNPYETWSDEDLKQAIEQIIEVLGDRQQKKIKEKKKSLNINGITVKDFVVMYAPYDEGEDPYFAFYIARDGKLYDIYYDTGPRDKKNKDSFHPWWPTVDENDEPCDPNGKLEDGEVFNAAYSFIPSGFAEAFENGYEYGQDQTEKAIEVLKEHGFETIIEAKPEDQGSFQEVYTKWLRQHETLQEKNTNTD